MTAFTPWPDDLAERYRAAGYWRGEPLGDLIRQHPSRLALVVGEKLLTYRQLDRRVDRLAAGLSELGVASGDRVVVQLGNTAGFVELSFALFRLGAQPIYALPAHREHEIGYLCDATEAVAYAVPDTVGGFDYRELARRLTGRVKQVLVEGDAEEFVSLADVSAEPTELPPVDPAGVALYLLSGGTTGTPKLIPRTHDDYLYNARASAEVCGLDADSVYLAALPAGHNFPLACPGILGTFAVGGTVVMAGSPSADEAYRLIEQEQVTHTAVVPTVALLWAEARAWQPERLDSLQLLQVGGAKLSADQAAQLRSELGAPLQQVFGMAEGLLNYTRLDDPADLVDRCQGRPLSLDDEVRILGPDGQPADSGELYTRGPYTIRGYYNAPDHNRTAFTPDGFYRSGDLVRRLPSGHLVVEGRVKQVINRGGDKVSAEEVEEHLRSHPAIRDVAVIALPHDLLGEQTCACVVADNPPSTKELAFYLRSRGLAAYKAPDRVFPLSALPLTPIGKIDKRHLLTLATDPEPRDP
ncbi:AMP-binding protein [Kribbella sandramycini]|uniref:2,3-dihydroxybenzoate-AMP ligase n=1 Tax=Kribbella sandramycini TaxID=60450 RepID=A0A7Y4KXK1_9ACTN|nr:AMP-binding protein [Kribbella sandramycini]MBB6569654.1 2,3-dihydroxybenzoate-AMP ligase [Kribbella sandramycini]NOL40514.1 AMP-binding protein [Kribbella sandramycini]